MKTQLGSRDFKIVGLAYEDRRHEPTGKTVIYEGAISWRSKERIEVVTHHEGDVVLTIDLDALVREMGFSVMTSKGGKAVRANGAIVAKRTRHEVREISRATPTLKANERYAEQ